MCYLPKGKTTWEGFVPPCKFKTGDVLFVDCSDDEDKSYQYIFILNDPDFYGKWHSYCHLDGVGCFHSEETYLTDDEYHPRFATEEEKAKLFDAIKENGYKWNEETKTLEKLVKPNFKVGDIIQDNGYEVEITKVNVEDELYEYKSINTKAIGSIPFSKQDYWKLVSNKFDITTLVPFESKVLVKDNVDEVWLPCFFGGLSDNNTYPYRIIGGEIWKYCIPYEGNEHLSGKRDDCSEYYKNW